jgi:hypothetical protein
MEIAWGRNKVRVLGHVPGGIRVFVDRRMGLDSNASINAKRPIMEQQTWLTGITGYIHSSDLRQ